MLKQKNAKAKMLKQIAKPIMLKNKKKTKNDTFYRTYCFLLQKG